jgi:exopolysaccharide biosynthesis polyprenyl glycosylphosphotransferase
VIAKVAGLYDRDEMRSDHSTVDDLAGIFHVVTIAAWLLFAGSWLTGLAQPSMPKLLAFWGFSIVLITLARVAARAICRRSVMYLQNTIIVGCDRTAQLVARKLVQHGEYGLNLVGFVTDGPSAPTVGGVQAPVLGRASELGDLIRLFDVERVVIASSDTPEDEALDLVRRLKDLNVQIDIVPRVFEVVGPSAGIHTIEGIPLVGLPPLQLSRSSKLLKRGMDVMLSATALVVLLPVLLAIAVAIKLDSRGPVFFKQTRMGAGNRRFRIIKFRTMYVGAEERKSELAHLNIHSDVDPRMFKVVDDPRVTGVGRLLRRCLLDELPQLVNVLRGEMSLVGPRPLILEEDRFVDDWARKRLDLKPGMTGLWQVLGASTISFDEMVKLDYVYVTNWSIGQDIRLLFRTIPLILKGAGGTS